MTRTADTAAITFYNLLLGEIARAFDVAETASPKLNDIGMKLLEAVSNFFRDEGVFPEGGGAEDEAENPRYSDHHVLHPTGG